MNLLYYKGQRSRTIALDGEQAQRQSLIKMAKAGLIMVYVVAAALMAFSQG